MRTALILFAVLVCVGCSDDDPAAPSGGGGAGDVPVYTVTLSAVALPNVPCSATATVNGVSLSISNPSATFPNATRVCGTLDGPATCDNRVVTAKLTVTADAIKVADVSCSFGEGPKDFCYPTE